MKVRTSLLKRCLALALALVLLVSGTNVSVALRAFAADGKSVSAGNLVADNYGLTDEEKALLRSGYLAGDNVVEYNVPVEGDNLVTVNTDKKTVTADSYEGWVPTVVEIMVNGESAETIELTGNDCTYTYDGNAFAVKVTYVLDQEVEGQQTMLDAMAGLKQGTENLKAAYDGTDSNLGTVVLAMDTLKQLAAGITMDFGGFSMSAQFGADAIAAVNALSAQLGENDTTLDMQDKNAAYNASASKTQYLVENGAAYKTVLDDTYTSLNAIKNDPLANNDLLDGYLQGSDPTSYTAWMAFKNILNALVSALEPLASASWKTDNLVSNGTVDYADLDTLVAALGELTAVAVTNPLRVDDTTIQVNMSMKNVTVKVELKTVVDEPDSAELVAHETVQTVVLTLDDNSTAEQILAAVEASGVEAEAKAAWGDAYVDGQYEATATELPDSLTEDIEYTITYAPKNYTVTLSYAEDMSVPYGYQLTLPVHSESAQAYDYTVNGTAYAQGEVITITGDTEITRSAGKAYNNTDLYTVVADNYGNDVAKAILKSGALKDNEVINVREPDPADAASLLELINGILNASNYDANYRNLKWAPYTYGAEGTENAFSGSSAAWSEKSVKVQYILSLTNFGQERAQEKAQEILDLAAALKQEMAEQKSAMDSLAAMEDTLAQLDKTKLGALIGVIDVTDFTPDDGTDADEENIAIRAALKTVVSNIIANNVDTNNYLKIYNIVAAYNTDGMSYYYKNYATIKAEVESLAGYMTELMSEEEALMIMCSAADFPEYAEKIADVEGKLNDYNARLSAPNAAIDVDSDNLGKLITALSAEGSAECTATDAPYLLSKVLTAMDESQINVQVIITTPEGGATVTTDTMDRGTILTQDMVDSLMASVDAKVNELLGENIGYYTLSVTGDAIDELVGTELDAQVNIYYDYTYKNYTVKIDGEDDQTVNINDLEINLPKHPTAGFEYRYTVDGVAGITASTYTFTLEQIDRLFADGTYTITRVEVNTNQEQLENAFAEWAVYDENGNIVALNAEVDGNKDGIMSFVSVITNACYSYIGLNGEDLMYLNEENTTEICLQTLINAILNDNSFGSQTLIDLGNAGNGKMVSAQMQLGNSADDIKSDIPFTLTLTSVPGKMVTVASALEKVKPYMTFNSQDGVMSVNLNLPEKVYEVYLTALLATGEVDKTDMNAVNAEIAYMFLYDYIDLIINTDATTTTYTNTLAKLGQNYDLTGYEDYYQMLKKALTNEGVVVNSTEDDGIFDVSVTAAGKKSIDGVLGLLGVDSAEFNMYLSMIKEYKSGDLTATAVATLGNVPTSYEALILDLGADGVQNKFDYTNDLPARVPSIANQAAVILLGDVDGDLVFPGTTILDLNGYTVNGSVSAAGELYIVDSRLETATTGSVTGSVSATVILGGKYDADVSAYLKDGYKQVNGVVQNALYTIESDGTNVTFVVNTDVLSDESVGAYRPFVQALAADIAVDLALNYFTAASLDVDGSNIYTFNFDQLIALLKSDSKVDDVITKTLACINAEGITTVANSIIADLLDFAAIETALNGDGVVATYELSTAPWAVVVEHVTDEDYIDVTITSSSDAELAKTQNISLKLTGSNTEPVAALVGELADIVNADETHATVNLEQPTYDAAGNQVNVSGSAEAVAVVDMSANSDYATMIGVILGYGNSAKRADVAAAINNDDMDALKEVVDNTTVAELFTALKALSRNVDFAAMASAVGVEIDVTTAGELEEIYHLVLCAGGKVLEELDISGYTDKMLGSLYDDQTGYYILSKWNINRNGDVSYRGYTAEFDGTITELTLKLKLFGETEEPDVPDDPDDPTEPTEPDEPTVPTKPDEPTVPTEPDEPTEPTVPDEPTVPTEPDEPTVPSERDEPTVEPTEKPDDDGKDDVPKTGDITMQVVMGSTAFVVALLASIAFIFKRKTAK